MTMKSVPGLHMPLLLPSAEPLMRQRAGVLLIEAGHASDAIAVTASVLFAVEVYHTAKNMWVAPDVAIKIATGLYHAASFAYRIAKDRGAAGKGRRRGL